MYLLGRASYRHASHSVCASHTHMPLMGVSLRGCTSYSRVSHRGVHLTGVHLIRACISQGMDLRGVLLRGVHLIGFSLSLGSLTGGHLHRRAPHMPASLMG